MNKYVCITIGDIKGIGYEILLNSYNNNEVRNFILFSNFKIIKKKLKVKKNKINIINQHSNKYIVKPDHFNIFNYDAKNNFENSYLSMKNAYFFCKKNNLKGIITLPINKNKIIKNIDDKFVGQTEFYQKLDKKNNSNMIFKYKNYIFTTITTHLKISELNKKIKEKKLINNKLLTLNNTLKLDFGIKKPNLIISGFNPHAGENNNLGNEERKIFLPQIKKLKNEKVLIDGPFSADSMINKKNLKKYDCFIFSFHDQALIPYKLLSKNRGVNYTSNLSIIRVSPDHGTAYDIVGKNIAINKSFLNCFKLIDFITKNRKKFDKF